MKKLSGNRNDESTEASEEDLLNNILPSYEMFQSTISKTLVPTNENFRVDPPIYETSNVTTPASEVSYVLESYSSNVSESDYAYPSLRNEEQSSESEPADIWENTIIANVHKLVNLEKKGNSLSKGLDIDIKVTERVCQKGKKPDTYDPLCREFKQGDYLHGYVTIQNNLDVPIPFDMVYVGFEGIIVNLENDRGVIDVKKPLVVHKFLNMVDLFASWTYSNINRLVTDDGNPYDWCEGELDPYDNTVLSIDVKRFFQPGVVYKRYFTFKIPDHLLEDICEEGLPMHTKLPPSFGLNRFAHPILAKVNKGARVMDFSFIDSFVSYSIHTRVIARASEYGYKHTSDHYLLAKEANLPIRLTPRESAELYPHQLESNTQLFYQAFVDSVTEKLRQGHDMMLNNSRLDVSELTPWSSRDSNEIKLHQLYVDDRGQRVDIKSRRDLQSSETYQYHTEVKKLYFTGQSKVLGMMLFSTPRHSYTVNYVLPPKFRMDDESVNTRVSVPLTLTYLISKGSEKHAAPEIKRIEADLVALTIKSEKYPIPVEFNHDMLFDEQKPDMKDEGKPFDYLVIRKFKSYLKKMDSLIKSVDCSALQIPRNMYHAVKCLAALRTKYINLILQFQVKFNGTFTSLKDIPWVDDDSMLETNKVLTKNFELVFDTSDSLPRAYSEGRGNFFDNFTLVPDFQSCYLTRMYYIKILIKLTTGELLKMYVPAHVQNDK